MLKQGFIASKTEKIAFVFLNHRRIAWKEITALFCACIQLHAKAAQLYFLNIFTKLT